MKNDIDLVILDMIMPGLSGSETFDRIMELNPSVKVILSSGYSLDGQAQQIMDRGCRGFIQKPFDIARLSRKVREVLEK
jgi:DNA-binding NtrC family response regulator